MIIVRPVAAPAAANTTLEMFVNFFRGFRILGFLGITKNFCRNLGMNQSGISVMIVFLIDSGSGFEESEPGGL
jgi:hypothetical protein